MHLKAKTKTITSVALSIGLAVSLSPVSAFAVTSEEKQAEVESVGAQLDSLNEELSLAVDNYNMANRNYDAAVAEANECQEKVNEAQAKIDALQERIETRATSMYRTGATSYLDVLMGSSSFDDFATVWDTLNTLNTDDTDLVVSSKAAKEELDAAKAELDEKEAEAQAEYESAASYKSEIESMTAEYESIYNSLSAEYQQLLAEEEAARAEAQAAATAAYFPTVSAESTEDGAEGVAVLADDEESSEASASSSASSSQVGGSDAVSRAYSCIGLPYQYGAAGPSSFDCSGLVSYCLTGSFSHAYVSQDFWGMEEVSDPQPGDVVACSAGHCGLYIGGGQMIEAPYTGATVCVSSVRGKIVRP